MSKTIGITPGPVEFTNLDNEDLAAIKQFNPSNTGSTGQVLTKTANGYDWETPSIKEFEPSNTGSTGQVLTKTANGYDWETPSSGGASNGMVGFYSTFDCETNDNYQGGVPINPESTQAGSICVDIYYVLKKLDANNTVVSSSTYDFKVSLSNNAGNIGGAFEGSVSVTPNGNSNNGMVTFYVTLIPENQQGTIIFNTSVSAWILVPYSATSDGAYTFKVEALTGGTEAIPQVLSGCANAEY